MHALFIFQLSITNLLQASVLELINNTTFDEDSEAYSRLMIDLLILACFTQHKKNFSEQSKLSTNDPTTTTSPILKKSELSTNDSTTTTSPILKQSELLTKDSYNQTTPTTPSNTTESTSQPLPIKVFHEMHLSVQVERGGIKWVVSGIADWAMGYGDRAVLEDGTILLAVEAKRKALYPSAEGRLLAYLATIRQLRIQANKENVMTQGFYSDGENYRFICIRNDGTVMRSESFDTSNKKNLKPVFNFLLNMLTTAANSSPNTSPMKPGKERDEKITNLDQDVFVRVIEDQDMYDDADIAEEDESCRLSITKTKVV
jgi:hypothetical protein